MNSFEEKTNVIAQKQLAFYIDDQPGVLKTIPAHVGVMLFRNEGIFDYDDRQWMFSQRTGKLV